MLRLDLSTEDWTLLVVVVVVLYKSSDISYQSKSQMIMISMLPDSHFLSLQFVLCYLTALFLIENIILEFEDQRIEM